jgi:ribosomal protein S18 acetylase RimI-like enzyme
VPGPRELPSLAALLEASGNDPFVRWQVSPDLPLTAWQLDRAVAFVRTRTPGRRQLTVLGSPRDAAGAVHALARHLGDPRRNVWAHGVTVPRGTLALLGADTRLGPGDDWDWMWIDRTRLSSEPADPRDQRLPSAAESDVTALLASASPRHSSDPGDDDVVEWFGIRAADGHLLACAAHTQKVPGVPHLASIATDPVARRHGLGAALTAGMTRTLLDEGAPVVTLSMYADNTAARRLYDRIGFVCSHRWSSRPVLVRRRSDGDRSAHHAGGGR